ncbi:thaumatin-like protein [Trametes versicolor FP-101664 SS1]|uniref:thaumatin-like protein n=1 Tax=Trametes versicolor (strain FP-101664) TaxID=717944 RepID=UPI0004622C22|nr:thaumatin-like protein [Trametes versicolor FP-101664 SS1]EIW57348.1 thaumatin-like protein [Trametes versicolor FP-101664 SS1]
MKSFIATVTLAVLAAKASARTFTVVNNCPFTIWSLFTDLNVGSATPDQPTGWEQDAAQTVSFTVPDNWQAGRIWGRRDCDFSTGTPGPNQCLDGGCNGGLECDPHTGTGVPPATVAEFTLGVAGGAPDNYDVSLVDGFNLPMAVTNSAGCHEASCPVDLNPNCPTELKGPFDSNGVAVGCKSACAAGLGGDPANNPNCCSGSFNTPATCPNSGVQDYSYFKSNCPDSYAYAFDESSGTALWTCDAASAADYTITFCP